MKKLIGLLFAGLIMISSGVAQAYCGRVMVYESYDRNVTWWVASHYTPCGDFVPGHWCNGVVGYRIGKHKVFVPGHYSKVYGWEAPSVRYVYR